MFLLSQPAGNGDHKADFSGLVFDFSIRFDYAWLDFDFDSISIPDFDLGSDSDSISIQLAPENSGRHSGQGTVFGVFPYGN